MLAPQLKDVSSKPLYIELEVVLAEAEEDDPDDGTIRGGDYLSPRSSDMATAKTHVRMKKGNFVMSVSTYRPKLLCLDEHGRRLRPTMRALNSSRAFTIFYHLAV
eukprot:SAG31_NODE_1830_length_7152_cov_2.148306_8_plen_105_part_00